DARHRQCRRTQLGAHHQLRLRHERPVPGHVVVVRTTRPLPGAAGIRHHDGELRPGRDHQPDPEHEADDPDAEVREAHPPRPGSGHLDHSDGSCFMTTTSTDTIRESTAVVEASHIAVETTQQMIERLEKSPLVLEAKDLDVTYVVEEGEVPACRDIDLQLRRGEILGIAGESASGKSTLLNALSRLQRPPAVTSAGSVVFHPLDGEPVDLTALPEEQLRRYRWDSLSIVMQSAMASLNPVLRLDTQFIDVIMEHDRTITKQRARDRAGELLEMVGIPAGRLRSFSYQLSGGMQQRALIALSLASNPEVVFMDVPTTDVDVVRQR